MWYINSSARHVALMLSAFVGMTATATISVAATTEPSTQAAQFATTTVPKPAPTGARDVNRCEQRRLVHHGHPSKGYDSWQRVRVKCSASPSNR